MRLLWCGREGGESEGERTGEGREKEGERERGREGERCGQPVSCEQRVCDRVGGEIKEKERAQYSST